MSTPTGWKETREQFHKRRNPDSPLLEVPDVGFARYMLDYLFEVGPMAGEHAVDWAHVRQWQDGTGVDLSEFEFVTLVDMSRTFVGMIHAAKEPEYLAPNYEAAKGDKSERHARAAAAYARAIDKKKG